MLNIVPAAYLPYVTVALAIAYAIAQGMALFGPTQATAGAVTKVLNIIAGNWGNATNVASIIPPGAPATPTNAAPVVATAK